MKKYIIITADTNDGDYTTSINAITDEEIQLIKPVAEAIRSFEPYNAQVPGEDMQWNHRHNFPCGESFPRQDLGEKSSSELYGHLDGYELFDEFCPYGEYGIHTIESVKILTVTDEETLI